MGLNLSNAFAVRNNIKTKLKSDFVSLKFIGIDKITEGYPRKVLGIVNKNFFYERREDSTTGQVLEHLSFIAKNSEENTWAKNCVFMDLVKKDGDFLRVKRSTLLPPDAYKYEWLFRVTSQEQDKVFIQ